MHPSCHSNSPQKVRPEDGGESQRTLNRPGTIPAELCSWSREKRNKPFSLEDVQDPEVEKQLVVLTKVDLKEEEQQDPQEQ